VAMTATASAQLSAALASQKDSGEAHRQGAAAEAHQLLAVSDCAVTSAPNCSDFPRPAIAKPAPTKMPCHWNSSRLQQGSGIHQLAAETSRYSRNASGLVTPQPS
jgi:hypothetical protein